MQETGAQRPATTTGISTRIYPRAIRNIVNEASSVAARGQALKLAMNRQSPSGANRRKADTSVAGGKGP